MGKPAFDFVIIADDPGIKWKAVSFKTTFFADNVQLFINWENRDPVDLKVFPGDHNIAPLRRFTRRAMNEQFVNT
jgi:hypothetical protein